MRMLELGEINQRFHLALGSRVFKNDWNEVNTAAIAAACLPLKTAILLVFMSQLETISAAAALRSHGPHSSQRSLKCQNSRKLSGMLSVTKSWGS